MKNRDKNLFKIKKKSNTDIISAIYNNYKENLDDQCHKIRKNNVSFIFVSNSFKYYAIDNLKEFLVFIY